MNSYDLNVILDPNLNETQLKLEKDAITAQIERVEGTVQELDEWGNKRLAYPIRKLNEGYYLIYKLSLSETAPRQLSTGLRLRDNIMRVLVTRDRPEQRTRKEGVRESRDSGGRDGRDRDRGDREYRGDRDRSDRGERPERSEPRVPRTEASTETRTETRPDTGDTPTNA